LFGGLFSGDSGDFRVRGREGALAGEGQKIFMVAIWIASGALIRATALTSEALRATSRPLSKKVRFGKVVK